MEKGGILSRHCVPVIRSEGGHCLIAPAEEKLLGGGPKGFRAKGPVADFIPRFSSSVLRSFIENEARTSCCKNAEKDEVVSISAMPRKEACLLQSILRSAVALDQWCCRIRDQSQR